MNREILATYHEDGNFSFVWLEDEADVEDWLEEYKEKYTQIEIIAIRVKDILYQSEDIIEE